ncbi:MAG: hypothetical protein NTY89_23900 [Nostocales cyanobacterium LacPavin_0920_SED1_MAG_38_18]|nr:hypothetical protein [Nostocales cyanobacterium LacPavin_0920_SED1_MAG_38_18]
MGLCAIAVWGCWESDRCLGILGCDRLKLVVSDRCLGMWGGRSFKIMAVCDRCLGLWSAIV